MPFWSSNKIEQQHNIHSLIEPFEASSIKQGAYELKLGHQAVITCDGDNVRKDLAPKEVFYIPPGQFGLMLTEEIVTLPANVLGLISLKTSVKARGLVNVSGFHVDPGYKGRLKFWVYNAGNQNIPILRGDPTFLIWFSEFDQETRDPYPIEKREGAHNEITAIDLQQMLCACRTAF
jgi:dCTP deaminase